LHPIQHETPNKIDPIVRLIEVMLDFASITGFLSAIRFLISITAHLVF